MKTLQDFLDYILKEKISEFTFKSISEHCSKQFDIPKNRIILFCRIMRELDMIKKISIGGGCKSVCASCYEYGCTEPIPPPINYWKVISFEIRIIS